MKLLYAAAWIVGIALMGQTASHSKSPFLSSADFSHRTFAFTAFSL